MTPLLGTKSPSAPVGDKSGGERRAARSLLSCALWSGMGRLWRGMGGMGRPEQLSEHHPHKQQGLSGFHETRNTRPGYCQARRVSQREFRGFHETRNTRHETRPFFESRPFCRVGRPLTREGGRPAGFKGGCTKRCVNEWKEVYLNPETGITTFTESRLGSRPGISHNIPLCVGKIRISPCCQSSASAHCGNRDIGFMDVSSRRITSLGPQVSPSGGVQGERATNRETRPLTRRAAQAGPSSELFTKHETRNTKHGLCGRSGRHGSGRVASRKTAARSLLSCALWRGMGRLWRGMGGHRPQRRQHGLLGFHQPRDTQHAFPLPSGDSKESNLKPDQRVFTNHETRVTNHGLFSKHGFYARRQVTAFRFTAARYCPPLPAIARHFPAFLPSGHGLPAHGSPRLPTRCPRLPMTARYCSLQRLPAASLRTASDFRSASRRAPEAAAPVALRPPDCFRSCQRQVKPCRERGTFYVEATDAEPTVIIDLDKAPLSIGTRP